MFSYTGQCQVVTVGRDGEWQDILKLTTLCRKEKTEKVINNILQQSMLN